jgi:hypothetical protein
MPVSAETRERLRQMSERLGDALSRPLPNWLRTAVHNCLIELDRLSDDEARGLEIAGVLARGESLLSVCASSAGSSSSSSGG